VKVHAHARFGGIFTARSDASPGAASGVHRGLFKFFALGRAYKDEAEKHGGKLSVHTLGSL
jgi:hypothetical protein